ncbi:6-phosphogluconolactonase [Nocardioides mesophilus]|uniref:6-phosphogluconolactonase n=1 Tax=Nocardioides mesophilus TaxID=433659 RepID=A0A7G9RBC7_9ACTN|nr:6-phosphogluconolactonase [Nocardioides mesophilus]QNN52902.1 6-phosphogluconolactonase [Nocardioides mesophilus]
MTEATVEVVPDPETLATRVAARLLERLAAVQAEGRVPSISLTGGSIAEKLHREVARLSATSGVDWSWVEVWWGDERFVARDDADRNARQARHALLDQVPVDPARIHEMPATGDGDIEHAAAAYAEELRSRSEGPFDVMMLGMGPDGHVASLFPGHPQLDVDDRDAVAVTDSPKPPPQRVSLTYRALNRSRSVWFLVTTEDKAEAAAAAISGADRHDYPAAGVHGQDETVWFLDEAAASRLG